MARIKYNQKEIVLLARIMRAEALGEGNFGMMLVGNVVVNRVRSTCPPFKKINTLNKAIYQKGQFEGVGKPLFNQGANAKEREMALKTIKFWRAKPAYAALYFQNPGKGKNCKKVFWSKLSGRYKNHCYYNPENPSKCGL